MIGDDWKVKLNEFKAKNSGNNLEIQQALDRWHGFTTNKYDTRSTPKAAETFQDIAEKYKEGCVVLALVFYELFMEFGEYPRKSLFEEGLYDRVDDASKDLEGEEKEIVDWFLTELSLRD